MERKVGVGDNYLHPEIYITLAEYDQWVWPASACGHCGCGMLTVMPRFAIPADAELLFSRLREVRVYGSVVSKGIWLVMKSCSSDVKEWKPLGT